MIYAIKELLTKMGAPEATEKKQIEWFYFNKDNRDIGGMASIRFEANGERLIAELKQVRENVEDDDGNIVAKQTDTFFMAAERTAREGHYRITNISFDNVSHDKPSKAVSELGLSVFHAKALDISIRMIEQSFDKEAILEPRADMQKMFNSFMPESTAKQPVRDIAPRDFGNRDFDGNNVVMFRPRANTSTISRHAR